MRATIQDVATEAGVSVATVSRALRGMNHVADETRRRVIEVAGRLGYVPHFGAAVLAGGATSSVGLVAPYFDIWYTSQVVAGVEQVLSAAGHDLVIYAADTHANRSLIVARAASLRTRIDGLLLVDFFPDAGQLSDLTESGLNLVSLGEALDGVASISIDNFDAAYRATRHLIEIGHVKIAIGGAHQVSLDPSPVLAARIDGYRAALEDVGIKPRPEYSLGGMLTVAGGRQALNDLLDKLDRPTAAFFMSDEMAVGAMAEARRQGVHVPLELSIVGFDDHDLAAAMGLTTIRQRVRELGAIAARRMLAISEEQPDAAHELMPVELIVRDTTTGPH